MYRVNGVMMPDTKSFTVNIADLDGKSDRNADGELIRDRIGTKRKLEIEYPPLDPYEISLILKAISPVFVEVEFPDPQEGRFITKTMYAGDKSSPMFCIKDGKPKWSGLKFNLIEK